MALCEIAVAASWIGPPMAGASRPATDAQLPTPLATSVTTSAGSWATVAMGHLDQPLNTFWQLFFRPSGSSRWSNLIEVTAVASNGGLVLSTVGGQSLVVGTRPANLLTFSALADTFGGGRSWSPGPALPGGLSNRPDALAVSPNGSDLALVGGDGHTRALASTSRLVNWQTLATQRSLSLSASGRTCGLSSVTAVAYQVDEPMVGLTCRQPGVVGILADDNGVWQPAGPVLPSNFAHSSIEVLSLRQSDAGLSTLLAATDADGTGLITGWELPGGSQWSLSQPLRLLHAEQVVSYGPANGTSQFVLLSSARGQETIEITGAPGAPWQPLPAPPVGTATVVFSSSGVDALVVKDAKLTDWVLAPNAKEWTEHQLINVPIEYGSSG